MTEIILDTKLCHSCKTVKLLVEFNKASGRRDGLQVYCRECSKKSGKTYEAHRSPESKARHLLVSNKTKREQRAANPEEIRKVDRHRYKRIGRSRRVLKRMNLTDESFTEQHKSQEGLCYICKRPESKMSPRGTVIMLSIDHDRSCCPGDTSCGKCLRKLLCWACNTGLGQFKDHPENLRSAANYVEEHKNQETN